MGIVFAGDKVFASSAKQKKRNDEGEKNRSPEQQDDQEEVWSLWVMMVVDSRGGLVHSEIGCRLTP